MTPYCENPNEPLRIQRVEDYRISPHLHTSAEIIYVEAGEAVLTIGSLDYSLSNGDYALVLPNTLHSLTPSASGTSVYVINCKEEIIPDVIRRCSGLRPASPVLRAMDVPETLSYALSALTFERDKYIAFSWANLIATVMISKLRFAEIRDGVTSDLTNRILSYLGSHFREQVSLDQLAEVMNVSRFHLSHIFSAKLGIGFKEYLNNLRVEYAKNILRSTDTPISDICSSAGFENQRTFNRVFRDLTGASPRDYRLRREDFNSIPPEITPLKLQLSIESNVVSHDLSALSDTTLDVVKESEHDQPPAQRRTHPTTEKKLISQVTSESSETAISDIGDLSGVRTEPLTATHESNSIPKKKKKEQAWFL